MRISISGISATCPSCTCDSFIPLDHSLPGRQDLFNCAQCGADVSYSELILRIGDEAMRRAKHSAAAGGDSKTR
jgi:hypothetical protein